MCLKTGCVELLQILNMLFEEVIVDSWMNCSFKRETSQTGLKNWTELNIHSTNLGVNLYSSFILRSMSLCVASLNKQKTLVYNSCHRSMWKPEHFFTPILSSSYSPAFSVRKGSSFHFRGGTEDNVGFFCPLNASVKPKMSLTVSSVVMLKMPVFQPNVSDCCYIQNLPTISEEKLW